MTLRISARGLIDQDDGLVDILSQADRQINGGQRLAVAIRRARYGEGLPTVCTHTLQYMVPQHLIRIGDGVLLLRDYDRFSRRRAGSTGTVAVFV